MRISEWSIIINVIHHHRQHTENMVTREAVGSEGEEVGSLMRTKYRLLNRVSLCSLRTSKGPPVSAPDLFRPIPTGWICRERSELVGISRNWSESVGIGRNPWSEMLGALMGRGTSLKVCSNIT